MNNIFESLKQTASNYKTKLVNYYKTLEMQDKYLFWVVVVFVALIGVGIANILGAIFWMLLVGTIVALILAAVYNLSENLREWKSKDQDK